MTSTSPFVLQPSYLGAVMMDDTMRAWLLGGGGGGEVADSRAHWALHATHLCRSGRPGKRCACDGGQLREASGRAGCESDKRMGAVRCGRVGEWESVAEDGDARMGASGGRLQIWRAVLELAV